MITKERKQSSLFGDNWIYKNLLEKFPDHPLINPESIRLRRTTQMREVKLPNGSLTSAMDKLVS